MIKNMAEKGICKAEIARQLGIDRKSVRKYANSDNVPSVEKYSKRGSKLVPYRDKIKELVQRYNLSIVRILEEIRLDGYDDDGKTILVDYCFKLRKDHRI